MPLNIAALTTITEKKNIRVHAYNDSQVPHYGFATLKVQHRSAVCLTKFYGAETHGRMYTEPANMRVHRAVVRDPQKCSRHLRKDLEKELHPIEKLE